MTTNWADKFGFSREEAPMGGIPTLQARQRVFNNNMEQDKFDWLKTFQEAGLTGMYDGNKTWGRTVDEATLTGMFEGNDTLAREKFNDSSALGWANHALSKDRFGLQQDQFDWNKAIQEAGEGTTPTTGLDKYDGAYLTSLAQDSGLQLGSLKDQDIVSFISGLKNQFGWTTEEAEQAYDHMKIQNTLAMAQGNATTRSTGMQGDPNSYYNTVTRPKIEAGRQERKDANRQRIEQGTFGNWNL
jgi:hypothetical protein